MSHSVKKMMRWGAMTLASLLVVAGIAFFGIHYYLKSFPQELTQQDVSLVKNRLQQAQSLITMDYHYTNMGRFENQKAIKEWKIPFTEKEFILSYQGVIHAGIDLDEVVFEPKEDKLVVTLPKAKILAHEVDPDSLEIMDEDSTLFNPIEVTDITQLQAELYQQMEEEALENGLITEAQKYSKRQLDQLLNELTAHLNSGQAVAYEIVQAN